MDFYFLKDVLRNKKKVYEQKYKKMKFSLKSTKAMYFQKM